MVWVGRDLKVHPFPPPVMDRETFHYPKLALDTSREFHQLLWEFHRTAGAVPGRDPGPRRAGDRDRTDTGTGTGQDRAVPGDHGSAQQHLLLM